MARNMGKKSTYDLTSIENESPFTEEITRIIVPHKLKQPQMESYNSSGSPVDHVRAYRSRMALTTNLDELYCLVFPSTQKGPANQWFYSLKPNSINSFDQLSKQFTSQFISMYEQPIPDTQLLTDRKSVV